MFRAMGLRRCKINLVATLLIVAACAVSPAQVLTPPDRSSFISLPKTVEPDSRPTIELAPPMQVAAPVQVATLPNTLGSDDHQTVETLSVLHAAPLEQPHLPSDSNAGLPPNAELPTCDTCVTDPVGTMIGTCAKCTCQPSRLINIRPGDEVWLVSTRHFGCRSANDLCVHRFECEIGFVPASLHEYLASVNALDRSELAVGHQSEHSDCGQSAITMYVHGNRVDSQTACDRGLRVYEQLASAAGPHKNLCHVIWSWPSDIIPGMFLVDARQKAYKTHLQSYLLADFVSRHAQQSQIGLVGFSYGGRIILGSQHLLGGGETFGRRLPTERLTTVPRTRVAMWAPALPSSWIALSGLNGQAVQSVDHMLLYYNTRDPALRFYRKKLAESDTEALGFRGIEVGSLGPAALWVEQYNAAGLIGGHHSWTKYIACPEIVRRTVACALWHDRQDIATDLNVGFPIAR